MEGGIEEEVEEGVEERIEEGEEEDGNNRGVEGKDAAELEREKCAAGLGKGGGGC